MVLEVGNDSLCEIILRDDQASLLSKESPGNEVVCVNKPVIMASIVMASLAKLVLILNRVDWSGEMTGFVPNPRDAT